MSTKNRINQAAGRAGKLGAPNEKLYIRVVYHDYRTGEEETRDILEVAWGDPDRRSGPTVLRIAREMWDAI